jgi:alkylation response protein AidB-like acyl-CoA dehydrogenase
MYAFEPSEEQKMLIDAINRYAANDLRAAAREAEESGELPPKLIEKGWELGVLQASIPEAYGGFGERSAVTGVLAAEEMAWGDLAGAMAVFTPHLFALPILLTGSEAQKQEYLPAIVEGEWRPYTAAMIEPFFDFDPQDAAHHRRGAGWRIRAQWQQNLGAFCGAGAGHDRLRFSERADTGFHRPRRDGRAGDLVGARKVDGAECAAVLSPHAEGRVYPQDPAPR